MAIYEYTAKKDKGLVRFQLKDPSDRIVAEGTGSTVSEAQQKALEAAKHDGARLYLQQVKFPELAE